MYEFHNIYETSTFLNRIPRTFLQFNTDLTYEQFDVQLYLPMIFCSCDIIGYNRLNISIGLLLLLNHGPVSKLLVMLSFSFTNRTKMCSNYATLTGY